MSKRYFSLDSLFLLMLITFSKLLLSANSKTHPGDVKVLRDLKHGVNPKSIAAGSCLSSWDFSVDPCDNLFSDRFTCGFRCDRVVFGSSRVTELTLDPVGYSGSLNSTDWNLPFLQTLDISDNSFSSSVSDSLSNLTRLSRLSLSGNLFAGKIPASLGSLHQLEELYLNNNRFTGSIPSTFAYLINLKRLELQQNDISGEFPRLGSLKNLNFLDANDNYITGEIPSTLPPSLLEFSIRNNKLKGNLPTTFGDMKYLEVLDLSHNQLCGTINSALFRLPSLQQLTLSHNNFTSVQIPGNKGLNSKLIALDLSHNELRGLLPAFMAWMPELSALSLEHNKFTGMIPWVYALKVAGRRDNTSSLERLLLGGNYLFGPIPVPLMGMKPDSANVSLVDNCLYRCPDTLFFCRGGNQKSLVDCKIFGPVIP